MLWIWKRISVGMEPWASLAPKWRIDTVLVILRALFKSSSSVIRLWFLIAMNWTRLASEIKHWRLVYRFKDMVKENRRIFSIMSCDWTPKTAKHSESNMSQCLRIPEIQLTPSKVHRTLSDPLEFQQSWATLPCHFHHQVLAILSQH